MWRRDIHDSHIFSNVDLEVEILEHIHPVPGRVAESDILESKRPGARGIKFHTHSRLDRRGPVEELKNSCPSADSPHYRCLGWAGHVYRNEVKLKLTKKDLGYVGERIVTENCEVDVR
jgi:hypothetical protein